MEPVANTFGQLLKYSRIDKNITTRQLAKIIDVDHIILFGMEGDKPIADINDSTVKKLIGFFDWDAEYVANLIQHTIQLKKNYEGEKCIVSK